MERGLAEKTPIFNPYFLNLQGTWSLKGGSVMGLLDWFRRKRKKKIDEEKEVEEEPKKRKRKKESV